MLRRLLGRRAQLKPEKLALIDHAFSTLPIRSFADLGGVWGVEGGYTFEALRRFPAVRGTLVDTHFTPGVETRARHEPRLRLIRGSFGEQDTVAEVGSVDAVLMFDVLLHQVNPDWDTVLERYAPHVKCLLIYNQQWTGNGRRVRLLDLGEDEYFRNIPHTRNEPPYDDLYAKLDTMHPDHGKPWRDVHHVWQWGLTDADVEEKAAALGFTLRRKQHHDRFGQLPNFENHSFLFCR
ncbi:MAG: class I SAM-dependent methyltransferase [Gemmatimonadaceae bacterium]